MTSLFFRKSLISVILVFCLTQVGKASDLFDYDGDGRTDIIVGRDEAGRFTSYIGQSRDGFLAIQWGYLYPGDYDGDDKTDFATLSASDGNLIFWILKSSDNSVYAVQWGLTTDRVVSQDYDGDRKTDIAVYRSGLWLILRSSDNQPYSELFGGTSPGHPPDNPLTGGDYDGDGKADLAVVRYSPGNPGDPIPTTLYLRLSKDGTWADYNLGDGRYTGVLSGDYDGDGKADVTIWQGNLWLWIRSSDGQPEGIRWGTASWDVPVPGDYDGDGKTDPAVYRRGGNDCNAQKQSYFWIMGSRDGLQVIPWGLSCDTLGRDFMGYRAPIGF